jgi:hypothetical protein
MLPDDAPMFSNFPAYGETFSFTNLRTPANVTKEFTRRARLLGFPTLRLQAQATHNPVFCESRRGRLPSGSRAICLSFDVNRRGS